MKWFVIILTLSLSGCYGTRPIPEYNSTRKTIGLHADKSYDKDGYIVQWAWKQISGPAIKINNSGAVSTSAVLLLPGVYTFELTVTDNGGAKGKDTATIKY